MKAPDSALPAALAAIRAAEDDPFERVKAEELMIAYHARWGDEEQPRVLAVECEFTAPLLNPETGAPSRTFVRGGKMDAIVHDGNDVVIVEHKTSSADISPGSVYWQGLRMNSQISMYLVGARSLGFEPRKVLYDVLGKVALRPKEATPTEARKYTKPTKKDPTPRIYATQRETDESPAEFRVRVAQAIADDPNGYLQRGDVVRTDEDEQDSAADDWQQARAIADATKLGRYPRNPDSCQRYGGACEYLDVCTRLVQIDDPRYFRRSEGKHEELGAKHKLPIVSNSELSTFRACNRKHHYSYRLGYRPHKKSDPLRFGTLMHLGLEAWWKAVQAAQAVEASHAWIDACRPTVEVPAAISIAVSEEKKNEIAVDERPAEAHPSLTTDPLARTEPAPPFTLGF